MKNVRVIVQGNGPVLMNFAKNVMLLDKKVNKKIFKLCDIKLDCRDLSYYGRGRAVLYIKTDDIICNYTIKSFIEDCFEKINMKKCCVNVEGIEA